MTQNTSVIESSHPPEMVLKVVNPVMRFLLRTPVGRRMHSMLVLGFTGRKTGHHYEIPLGAHRSGGELYVLTGARWQHNFADARDVEVTLDGQTSSMRAVGLREPARIGEIYARRIAELGLKGAERQIGIKINVPRQPTAAEVADAVPREHLAAIRLEPRP
ncbi:MAG TPA: nitroreductase/quinone reductase family protein [Amycolatopsis sp.]|nr:nitroreductase/quinone reductase family protein [Amycolatopsis sp.]